MDHFTIPKPRQLSMSNFQAYHVKKDMMTLMFGDHGPKLGWVPILTDQGFVTFGEVYFPHGYLPVPISHYAL